MGENYGPLIWVHHDVRWWDWAWKVNFTNNPTQPYPLAFFPKVTFKWNDQTLEESMVEMNTVTCEQRNLGYKSLPGIGLWIHKGFAAGTEFTSWFDINVWTERAQWVEALYPYSQPCDDRFVLDFEPYWSSTTGNPRYPQASDEPAMAIAMQPLIDTLLALDIELYIMPGRSDYAYVNVLNNAGVRMLVLDEGSYPIPDNYQVNTSVYDDKVSKMAIQKTNAISAGLRYAPGFYETAVQKPDFIVEMAKLGHKEVWIFIRTNQTITWDKFGLPEFYAG